MEKWTFEKPDHNIPNFFFPQHIIYIIIRFVNCSFIHYAHPYTHPTTKWNILPSQSVWIFFYNDVTSSNQIMFNSDGIDLCQLHLSSLSRIVNINCVLINSNNMLLKTPKEKELQQYLHQQNWIFNCICSTSEGHHRLEINL